MTDTDVWVANELGQSVSRIDRTSGRVREHPRRGRPVHGRRLGRARPGSTTRTRARSRGSTSTPTASRGSTSRAPRGRWRWSRHESGWPPARSAAPNTKEEHSSSPSTARTRAPSIPASVRCAVEDRHSCGTSTTASWRSGSPVDVAQRRWSPISRPSYPVPSDGGLTYIFTIRAGIRYSTGSEVQASDFVIGLRRALADWGASSRLRQGRRRHAVHAAEPALPGNCDLRRGAVPTTPTRRLTIRLTEPDPDFLSPSWPFSVVPTPAGLPLEDVDSTRRARDRALPDLRMWTERQLHPLPQPVLRASGRSRPSPPPTPTASSSGSSRRREQASADVLAGVADVTTVSAADIGQLGGHAELLHQLRELQHRLCLPERQGPARSTTARPGRPSTTRSTGAPSSRCTGLGTRGADLSCQLLPSWLLRLAPVLPVPDRPG